MYTVPKCPIGKVALSGLCYDNCPNGYNRIADNLCGLTASPFKIPNPIGTPPGQCPSGYYNFGPLYCKSTNMWNNSITQKICSSDKDNINGLCYNKCPAGFDRDPVIPIICNNKTKSYTI